jgi:hypothetical protein
MDELVTTILDLTDQELRAVLLSIGKAHRDEVVTEIRETLKITRK